MLSPKYYLFYKFCVIICITIMIVWWISVSDEEIDATDDASEIVTLKENVTESGISK